MLKYVKPGIKTYITPALNMNPFFGGGGGGGGVELNNL